MCKCFQRNAFDLKCLTGNVPSGTVQFWSSGSYYNWGVISRGGGAMPKHDAWNFHLSSERQSYKTWTDRRKRLSIDGRTETKRRRRGDEQRDSSAWRESPGDQTIVANISDSSITWLLRASKLTGLLTCFAKRLMHTCMYTQTQTALMMTFRVILLPPPLSLPALPLLNSEHSAVCIIEH